MLRALAKCSPQQKGMAFAILAPFLYASKSAAIKFAPHARIEVIVFLRFLFDFLILCPFFLKHYKKLEPQQLGMHLLRALFATISIYCSVYGIRHLALVDAVILENTLPLFIPLIVLIWHREKISPLSCLMLFLGFSSLFFILKPRMDILHIASFASVGTGLASALSAVSVRALSKTEHPITILFYFNLFSGLFTFLPCWAHWEEIPFTFPFWLPFAMISVLGVAFQYAITKAYASIPTHVAGSFIYFSVLYSAIFGWIFWNERIDLTQAFGAVLLVGSGIFIFRQNRKEILHQNEFVASESE